MNGEVVRLIEAGKLLARRSVPEKHAALAIRTEGVFKRRFEEGETLPPGTFLLLPTEPVPVSFQIDGLLLEDGASVLLKASGTVRFGSTELDCGLIAGELLCGRNALSRGELGESLSRAAKPKAASLLSGLSLHDLISPSDSVLQALEAALCEAAVALGIEECTWREVELGGEALALARREAEAQALQNERLRQQVTSRLALQRSAAQERAKLEAERLERELKHLRDLDRVLAETGLEAQVLALGDEKLKAKLLELLLERELPAERLSARSPGRTHGQVEREFATLKREVKQLLRHRSLIYLAAGTGRFVWLWRLGTGSEPSCLGSLEVDLGPVRFLQPVAGPEGPLIGAGGVKGVVVADPVKKEIVETYRLPEEGSHGINGLCITDEWVWATHWELGLWRWPRGGGQAVRLLERPVRGVVDGGGSGVVCGAQTGLAIVREEGVSEVALGSEATALCRAPWGIACGTSRGGIYVLSGSEARLLDRVGGGPVTGLCVFTDPEAGAKLVVCMKEQRVFVLGQDGTLSRTFVAPRPVLWVTASWPLVAAAASRGTAYIWWAYRPEEVAFELSVPGEIRSIASVDSI